MTDTGNSALAKAQAQWIEAIAKTARGVESNPANMVEVIKALKEYNESQPKNGSGWISRFMNYVVFPLLVISVAGGVVLYGDVRTLQQEIRQCLKISP